MWYCLLIRTFGKKKEGYRAKKNREKDKECLERDDEDAHAHTARSHITCTRRGRGGEGERGTHALTSESSWRDTGGGGGGDERETHTVK